MSDTEWPESLASSLAKTETLCTHLRKAKEVIYCTRDQEVRLANTLKHEKTSLLFLGNIENGLTTLCLDIEQEASKLSGETLRAKASACCAARDSLLSARAKHQKDMRYFLRAEKLRKEVKQNQKDIMSQTNRVGARWHALGIALNNMSCSKKLSTEGKSETGVHNGSEGKPLQAASNPVRSHTACTDLINTTFPDPVHMADPLPWPTSTVGPSWTEVEDFVAEWAHNDYTL